MKTNHSLLALVLMAFSFDANALETGQTIRLVHNGKSIFVKDASLDENKPAVLWTETNVNAQRWTLVGKTNGTFMLQNDYTGFYLGSVTLNSKTKAGQVNRSNANSKGSWEFVPVEGTTDQYYIYQGTTRKMALAVPDTKYDIDTLTLVNTTATGTTVDPARYTWKVEVVEQMEKAFTKDKRDDMMNKWKARAYRQASTGWVIGGGGWWGDAEMFEIVLDALETTGDQQYATMFDNLYTNFISRNQDTWYQKGVNGYNEYNDDIAWMCIACVRAYLLTGLTKYRTTAKKNFDGMFKRADCYGNDLLQWKHGSGKGTNSCINGPAAVCACYLAIAQADDSYYEKAKKTYLAERSTLFEMSNGKPTGKIFDSYDQATGDYNTWASTYNQGTNLGAAIMLYNHYGDKMFKDDADAIIKWSEANMANSKGIIHVCQTVRGDLCGFKGIMLRYLRMYAETFNAPSHYEWIEKNAYHAWNNRNSAGITSSAWLTKSEEDFKHKEGDEYKDFGHDGNMTCVSAAFNCHLGAVESHDAYEQNEAEDFNFVRNAPVTYSDNEDEDGGGKVGPMKSNNYIGYRRVDFGDKPASHIDLRANISASSTGINVFLDQPNARKGILLCNIKGSELADLKTWDTIRKMINIPVTGVHNVYFVSSGGGQTNINWWQFQSLNPVYPDLSNGRGTITTSFAMTDLDAIVDDNLLSSCNGAIEEGSEVLIQYQSPSPMHINGYQFFSGNDRNGDPKGWSLQGSNDGENWETLHNEPDTTFSVQAQRYFAEVQTSKAYTHFRLLFELNEAQTSISISEWQLLGRCIDDTDLTADGGTITEGYEPLIDHVGTTVFTAPVTAVYQTSGIYTLTAYSITTEAASEAPVTWKLEGSMTGSSWKVIDQQKEAVFPYDGCTNIYRVNPDASYLYYRLSVTGEGAKLTQWQLFGKPDYGTYYADVTTIATILASDGSDIGALIDDDGKTCATISGTDMHLDIAVPLPVRPLGFSFVNSNDAQFDPQAITLYGYEDDGTETQIATKEMNFAARGSRLTYTVSSTKVFKQFRLAITESEGNSVRLADFELYGTVIAEADDPGLLAPTSVEATAEGVSRTELIDRISDSSRSTAYRTNFTEPVSITYTFDQPVSINAYSITAKDELARTPADWTLEVSNDGTTWTELDRRTGETFSQKYATQFYFNDQSSLPANRLSTNGAQEWSKYRLTVTATNGSNQLQIGEFQLLNIEPTDPTGIDEIRNEDPLPPFRGNDGGTIYDLAGRVLPQKGAGGSRLYIVGGRVVMIK